jgi:hypothetical protein
MGALDTSIDIPLAAIAALVRGAVKNDLGAEALLEVYQDPRDLLTLAANKLPSLAVYRGKEKRKTRSSGKSAQLITVLFDYILPATGVDARQKRWPVLARMWNEIADVVIAGHHEQVESDAKVLASVGITVQQDTPSVDYGYAAHGGQSYPIARGRIDVEYLPDPLDPNNPDSELLYKFLSTGFTFVQDGADQNTPSLPGTSTGEPPIEVALEGYPGGLE